jgi:hypothetical protein
MREKAHLEEMLGDAESRVERWLDIAEKTDTGLKKEVLRKKVRFCKL